MEVSTELSREEARPGFDETRHDVQKSQKLTVELEVTGGLKAEKPTGWRNAELDRLIQSPDSSSTARNLARGARALSPVDISAEYKTGSRLTVEAKVTAEQGRQIADGQLDVPNPFDPASMPKGTAVLIKGQALEKTVLDVGYRFFRTESEVNQLSGFGIGVEKLDGNTVKVTTGPVDTIENEAFLGLGTNQVRVGLNRETKLESSNMRTAEFDLDTPEGEKAYREFLMSGNVPAPTTPGVLRTARIETVAIDSQLAAELKIGDFGGKWEMSTVAGEMQSVIWSDGSRDETIFLRNNDRVLGIERKLDASGHVDADETKYSIVGVNAHPSFAANARMAFGSENRTPQIDGHQDVQLHLTSDDLLEIRDRARDHVERFQPTGYSQMESLAEAHGRRRSREMAGPTRRQLRPTARSEGRRPGPDTAARDGDDAPGRLIGVGRREDALAGQLLGDELLEGLQAQRLEAFAVHEEGRRSGDAQAPAVGLVDVHDPPVGRAAQRALERLHVEPDLLGQPGNQLGPGLVVTAPARLILEESLQHFPVAALLSGGLQGAGREERVSVKRHVANHQADSPAVLREQSLDDRIHRPAGLALRVQELDHGHLGVFGTQAFAVGANENRIVSARLLCDQIGLLPLLGAQIERGRYHQESDQSTGDAQQPNDVFSHDVTVLRCSFTTPFFAAADAGAGRPSGKRTRPGPGAGYR